jgi:cytochrome c-type biogenesis protein CcmF
MTPPQSGRYFKQGNFKSASWMIPEIGHFALALALAIAITQATVPLWGAHRRNVTDMAFARFAALGQLLFVSIAFACLLYAFVTSDFSVKIVLQNSHTLKPMLYKVSGLWGNHEGSMLLWVLILALFGGAVAAFGNNMPETLRARVLGIQGLIGYGFLTFIVFTSNPFIRLTPDEMSEMLSRNGGDGFGLNPILQDPGLAFHPPFLYLGYVGFSMAFSFAAAALLEGRVDACWARWVRPWVLAAWCFLTIGIALGSAWAYYTLGWGGYWFWDPVENASLMPWLAGTALLHCALVVERRQTLTHWTILLGIITFTLSLIGTFLVRSGVLTSVHTFAEDPARGVFILGLLIAATGGALTLYAIRMPALKEDAPFAGISRETGLIINNVLLSVVVCIVFAGTFYPLLIDLVGHDKISVGPPYYNRTFVPFFVLLLLFMPIGTMLKWKRDILMEVLKKLRGPAIIGAAAVPLTLAVTSIFMPLTLGIMVAALAMGLAMWLVAGSLAILVYRFRLGRVPLAQSLNLAIITPRSYYGLVIAHASMGLMIAGITGITAWSSDKVLNMHTGDTATIAGYQVKLRQVNELQEDNYVAQRAQFDVTRDGKPVTTLASDRRFYPSRQQETTVAGIRTHPVDNIYLAFGEGSAAAGWAVRMYHHPLAVWIWLGALGMAFGGLVSLSDRRLRIGAPQRARRPVLSPAE